MGENMPENCYYDLTTIPLPVVPPTYDTSDGPRKGHITNIQIGTHVLWSGKNPAPPPIGTPVEINFNGLGTGTVDSYFIEHGFLGVKVRLDNPPAWHVKQNKNRTAHQGCALVFGIELR
jgi:hypothetical protein